MAPDIAGKPALKWRQVGGCIANPGTISFEPHQEGRRSGVGIGYWEHIRECLLIIWFGIFTADSSLYKKALFCIESQEYVTKMTKVLLTGKRGPHQR